MSATTGADSTGTPTTSAGSTGAPTTGDTGGLLTAYDCPAGTICVQSFDGVCNLHAQQCVPNPEGCVAEYPCAAACQPLCGGDSPDACNNSDCPGELVGAVHCFGH